MSKFHQNMEALFGPEMTEEVLVDAFRPDHLEFTTHATAEAQGDGILVHGEFNTACARAQFAGEFKRLLYRDGSGSLVAHHQRMDVRPEYQRQDIAKAHLTKLVSFYDEYRVEYVHLDAVDDGPLVWPQLGFELREPRDKQLLREKLRLIIDGLGYSVELPARAPRIALMPPLDGVKVGLKALADTYAALGQRPIPMILDLHDAVTRTFLKNRGILRAKDAAALRGTY
jgi:GNAT superfamily N-acetyltransferase